jgi:hypothetical protein
VNNVLLRALAKVPGDRYASCGEFANALRMAFGLQRYDSDVAAALHQRALTDQHHRLGLEHADTLANHASLAAAYQEARRSDEAVALRQQALTDQQRMLGPDHPVTLVLWFSIAREMAARGEHTGAQYEFRDMLPHLRRRLGPDHPDTVAAAEWIDYIRGKSIEAPDGSAVRPTTGAGPPA